MTNPETGSPAPGLVVVERRLLERWVAARKFILTLNDKIGSEEFRAAWNELGEAEWALAALAQALTPPADTEEERG